MTVDDLRSFYRADNDSDLAETLGVARSAISQWRSGGIPISRQALIQIQSEGALIADLKQSEPAKAS